MSTTLSQTITGRTTSTSLSIPSNPSIYGQAVLKATVNSTGGMPTGSVTFMEGTAAIGTAALDSLGSAVIQNVSLPVGIHQVFVNYLGDSLYSPSSSAVLPLTISPQTAAISINSSPNPSRVGEAVVFTAVLAIKGGAATGSVKFVEGQSTLGEVNLDAASRATFSTSSLAVGSHAVTAVYAGDGNNTPNTSTPYMHTVASVSDVDVVIGATPSTQTLTAGQSATYGLTLTPKNTAAGKVAIGCTGAPATMTCEVSPSSVDLDGQHPASATATVKTTVRSSAALLGGGLAWLSAMFLLSVITQARRSKWAGGGIGILLLMIGLNGCGGGANSAGSGAVNGTPAGTYVLTVTATSGSISRATTVTVVVN
jgi:hypothetical protein